MRHFFIFFFLLTAGHAWTQATEKYQSPLSGFYRAEDLFEKQQYSAARREFRLFLDEYEGSRNDPFYIKALYYEGVSALELYNNDAVSMLEHFNREYPESIYKYEIFLRIGRYYYQKKDYEKTIEWLVQLRKQDVEPENLDEYHFKLGYAYFDEKRYAESKAVFYEVKDATSQYGAPSLYYYSHLSYMDGSYQTALEGFQKLMTDARFKSVVPYYITQIYYLQGRYEEVATFAPPHVDSLKPGEQVEMNHLIGDAYYRLGKYDEAVPFLEAYNEKAATTRDDDYQLGYAYFKSSAYDKAVKYFDKVARVKDTLGQIALYHAAESYVNLDQPAYARRAFGAASELDMDKMIQEDALYNYAILSYKLDLNPYDEAVVALEDYIARYPDSPRRNVVYQYLVNCYASTKNYSKALAALDKLPTKDSKLKGAYQLIAFNRGVELYQKSEFNDAIAAFKLVDKYPQSPELSAKAVYWTADAYYQLKNYPQAIQTYRSFIGMPSVYLSSLRSDAYYNIGYSYVSQQDHSQAAEAFRNYLKEPNLTDKRKKADATMRLADALYMLRDNQGSLAAYTQAYEMKSGYEDQALFYMARLYGLMGNREEKIRRLQDVINNYPRSRYLQNSIYEVAYTYYTLGNNDQAIRYFDQLVRDYPSSIIVKDALHYTGDAYFKKKDYVKAESFYKRVLSEYGSDRGTCVREVEALADVYEQQRQFEKIEALPGQYPCADSIRYQVEDRYYSQIIQPYDDSLYAQALPGFDAYLAKYPEGKYRQEVLNFKANALYALKREEEAVAVYRITLEGPNDAFTELAAQRSARYFYNRKQYEDALRNYQRLEEVARSAGMINTAIIGLMRCHFLLENYTNAAEYAQKVLDDKQMASTLRLEAEFARGISLARTNRFTEAIPSLEYAVKNFGNIYAVEAKYTIADGWFQLGDNKKSEAEIRALLKMKPAYDYWTARALILQTRILMAEGDLFQAEHTINSVIENYTEDSDGILTEAGELYDEIMQRKNQPKNIPEKSGTVIEVEETPGNE